MRCVLVYIIENNCYLFTLLAANISVFFNKLLFVLGGGMGGVFFLGGLAGPLFTNTRLGLGVRGGVGAGLLLGVDFGVSTKAAGIVTVLSDF